MIDREAICRRQGLPIRLAPELRGETPEALEADAAARSAIARMLGEEQPTDDAPDLSTVSDEALAAEQQRREADEQHDVAARLLAPKRGHAELVGHLHPDEEQRRQAELHAKLEELES